MVTAVSGMSKGFRWRLWHLYLPMTFGLNVAAVGLANVTVWPLSLVIGILDGAIGIWILEERLSH